MSLLKGCGSNNGNRLQDRNHRTYCVARCLRFIVKHYPPYFRKSELKCRCNNCKGAMDDKFMQKLSAMRREAGFPFVLSSAYRCPDYNSRVSTTGRTGPHTTGRAVDIRCFGTQAHKVTELAMKHGMTGIGWSQKGTHSNRFVHVDDLDVTGRPWIWSY